MRLGEGTPCFITGGDHEGKEGIVVEGRYTINDSQVRIGDEVVIVPQQFVEYYAPKWSDEEKAQFQGAHNRYRQLVAEGKSPEEAKNIAHKEVYGN